jgi:DNA polymerase III gamma/tau subunit
MASSIRVVCNVPSVSISQSTLNDIIELLTPDQLNVLAEKIARKDLKIVKENFDSFSNSVDAHLHYLNELASKFQWGSLSFEHIDDKTILLVISPNCFATEKGAGFYQQIYINFMKLLNFELVTANKNRLMFRSR